MEKNCWSIRQVVILWLCPTLVLLFFVCLFVCLFCFVLFSVCLFVGVFAANVWSRLFNDFNLSIYCFNKCLSCLLAFIANKKTQEMAKSMSKWRLTRRFTLSLDLLIFLHSSLPPDQTSNPNPQQPPLNSHPSTASPEPPEGQNNPNLLAVASTHEAYRPTPRSQ